MKKQIILPAALALALGATAVCTSGYAQTPEAPSQTTAPTAQPGTAPQNAQHRDHRMQGRAISIIATTSRHVPKGVSLM